MRLCMFVIKARSELKKSEKTAPANNYQSNADVVNVNKKPKQHPTLPEWWDFYYWLNLEPSVIQL